MRLGPFIAGLIGSATKSGAALAQVAPEPSQCGAWRMMHDWNMWWGGGGMWFGPLVMIGWLAVIVAIIVGLVRWLGGTGGGADRSVRTARDILDERYARGEIDREEYQKRKQDIAGA
jgi:putative membrane protein